MESIIESFKALTAADQKKVFKAINQIMDDKPKRVRKTKAADGEDKEAKEPTAWMKEIAAVRDEYLIKDEEGNPVLKGGKPTYSISYKEAMSMASARKEAADPEYATKKAALKAKYADKSEKTATARKSKGKKSPSSASAFADSELEPSETEQSDSGLPKASKPKVKKVAKLPKVKEGKKE
jgi:hypothetical protein